ncbi:uncharacterized protein LY79DRAFT_240245 [Colletotrichum navitas]|uniref:Uncharacterized protein n=1 Tax=Colletotrichum navitas TaxID=681940 RepID=A0AAD8PWU3_9PEZI|nr:uncharacterized protein LY79DRAFT_240245 [Colletotrichum navitas]KAK1586127.1 hypothetical protein LY79DRAFT_240245 [Colletotrichum navitas]
MQAIVHGWANGRFYDPPHPRPSPLHAQVCPNAEWTGSGRHVGKSVDSLQDRERLLGHQVRSGLDWTLGPTDRQEVPHPAGVGSVVRPIEPGQVLLFHLFSLYPAFHRWFCSYLFHVLSLFCRLTCLESTLARSSEVRKYDEIGILFEDSQTKMGMTGAGGGGGGYDVFESRTGSGQGFTGSLSPPFYQVVSCSREASSEDLAA